MPSGLMPLQTRAGANARRRGRLAAFSAEEGSESSCRLAQDRNSERMRPIFALPSRTGKGCERRTRVDEVADDEIRDLSLPLHVEDIN